MKIISKILIILLVATSSFAQDSTSKEIKTLLSGKITQLGLLVSAEGQMTSLNGGFKPSSGGSVMMLFNQKVGIGVAAYGIGDPNKVAGEIRTQAAYGGLQLEYTMNPSKVFHVSFPLLIGAGMASSDTVGTSNYSKGGRGGKDFRGGKGFNDGFGRNYGFRNETSFGIIQPGVKFEVNLFKFAKLYAGANYRIAMKSSSTTLTNSKLSGLGVQAGIKLGFFNYHIKRS